MIDGMPNIPNFKGLVTSGIDAAISFGGAFAINKIFGNQWGVFNQYGIPILLADNVISVQYQNTSTISSAPVEKGSFATYNKVNDPYQVIVRMSKGVGGPAARGLFIGQIDALSKSTLLFHVITPDYVYRNAAITGYDYRREPQEGARLIDVNISLQEVREVVVSYEEEEVKNPEDAKTKDGGEKQATTLPESMISKVAGRVLGWGRENLQGRFG